MKNVLIIFILILFKTCLFGQTKNNIFGGKTFMLENGENHVENSLKFDTIIFNINKKIEFTKSNIVFYNNSKMIFSGNGYYDSVVIPSLINKDKDSLIRMYSIDGIDGKWEYNDTEKKIILNFLDYEKEVETYNTYIYKVIIKPDTIELIKIK